MRVRSARPIIDNVGECPQSKRSTSENSCFAGIEGKMSKVWFVTGAGRGLGIDIAEKALAAGHAVVATRRRPEGVLKAIGAHDDLLTVALDITDPAAAKRAAEAAVDRFGRIDVLV